MSKPEVTERQAAPPRKTPLPTFDPRTGEPVEPDTFVPPADAVEEPPPPPMHSHPPAGQRPKKDASGHFIYDTPIREGGK